MRLGGFLHQKHYASISKRPLPASDAQVSDLLYFPYFLLQAMQLLFFYAAFKAHILSLIFRNPDS